MDGLFVPVALVDVVTAFSKKEKNTDLQYGDRIYLIKSDV